MTVLPAPDLEISSQALGRLLPMHLVLGRDGTIQAAGPTFARLLPRSDLVGEAFLDRFIVRRPPCITTMEELNRLDTHRLRLELADVPQTTLNAHCIPVAGDRLVVDMSFGINVARAVADFGLDQSDFAPTSLAVEMLYLIEAKSAAISELRDLTLRLFEEKSRAEKQAETDSLTGVLNRRGIERALGELIEDEQDFGLLHVDLDFFKSVNDTHGHGAGDQVLTRVARTLTMLTRASDLIGRLGGDEFLIATPGITDTDLLRAMASQIIETLDKPFDIGGNDLRISASAGVTSSVLYATPHIGRMIEDADRALYRSKLDGRTRATVYDPETMPGPSRGDGAIAAAELR